jgi:hypothetical protein
MALLAWGAASAWPGVAAGPGGTAFVNGDFDSGPEVGWVDYSAQGFDVIVKDLGEGVSPRSKFFAAWLGGYDNEQSYVRQDVTITDATPLLDYWTWIDSTESACTWDLGRVYVRGTEVSTEGLCQAHNTGGWAKRSVDLSVFAGQAVSVQFEVHTDASYISSQYIDDVTLAASPLPPLATSAAKNGSFVRLTWQHAAPYTGYEVWRSASAYFLPGAPEAELRANVPPPGSGTQAIYDDAGAIGNAAANYFCVVRGSGAGVTHSGNRTGEFDFALIPGN